MEPTDQQLLQRWAAGDDAASAVLVERHFDALFRFFRPKLTGEVDDLIHDVFVRCLERRHEASKWRSFRAYLFAVARHRLYARIREAHHAKKTFDPAVSSIAAAAPGLSSAAVAAERQGHLLVALQSIPLQLQETLELRYWEGMSGPELAEALEIPEGTARSRLRRGIEALRRHMSRADTLGKTREGLSVDDFDAWASALRRANPDERG